MRKQGPAPATAAGRAITDRTCTGSPVTRITSRPYTEIPRITSCLCAVIRMLRPIQVAEMSHSCREKVPIQVAPEAH